MEKISVTEITIGQDEMMALLALPGPGACPALVPDGEHQRVTLSLCAAPQLLAELHRPTPEGPMFARRTPAGEALLLWLLRKPTSLPH